MSERQQHTTPPHGRGRQSSLITGLSRMHPAAASIIALACSTLVGAFLVVGIGAFVAEVVFGRSIDPTEYTFPATVRNDSSEPVLLFRCDVDCTSFHDRDHLAPGAKAAVNTSSDNVPQWFLVADGTGATLGCLNLQYDHRIANLIVPVSQMGPCPARTPRTAPAVGDLG